MNVISVCRLLALLILVVTLTACGGSTLDKPKVTVDAGQDQQVNLPVERVWLSGKATIEKPHKFKSALWRQIAGPVQLQLDNAGSLNTHIVRMDTPGEYRFSLTVRDFFDQSLTDEVRITVTGSNNAPVVKLAQKRKSAVQGALVFIEGNVSDSDGEQPQLKWEIVSAPAQSRFTLPNQTELKQAFLAPKVPGEYRFKLSATDAAGAQAHDEILLNVESLEEIVGSQLNLITAQLYDKYKDSLANLAFSVEFSDHDYVWQGTAGYASEAAKTDMLPEQQFRIASITKTMVAYLAVKMVEDGYFTLDTPLSELLTDVDLPGDFTVAELHESNGLMQGDKLTVRQLLDQTTGIRDHVSYSTDAQAMDSLSMVAALAPGSVEIPEMWTSELIINNMLERGLTKELAVAPGEAFLYGNSNSDLLGFAMEKVTGQSLQNLLKTYVFEPLDMQQSYLEWHDMAQHATPADHYYAIEESVYGSELPDFMYGNHNINKSGINTSFAYAGGGVVSTLADMRKFMNAIDSYKANNNEALTDDWHNWKGAFKQNDTSYYALGRMYFEMEIGSASYFFEGHNGAWGSAAFNIKPLNVGVIAWDSHANINVNNEFIQQMTTFLHGIGYQAPVTN